MNRHERRDTRAKVGTVIYTEEFRDTRDGLIYWFKKPDGFSWEDGVPSDVKIHGPFKTDAEVTESQRLVLLGPQCEVTEGGYWDPAWGSPVGRTLQ